MKLLALICLTALCSWAHAETIQNYEQRTKESRCTVDPQDDSKMYCEQYCQFFHKFTNEQLGSENVGWNCNSPTKKAAWQDDWNRSNPDKQIVGTCTSGLPSATGYHAGECETAEETLTLPPSIQESDLISWSNHDPECPTPDTSSQCPRLHLGVRFVEDKFYTVNRYGAFYGNERTWVTGPPGTSGSELAANYNFTFTPIENTNMLTTSSVSSRMWAYEDWDPSPPGDNSQERHIRFNLTVCENGNSANCQSSVVTFVIGYDTN